MFRTQNTLEDYSVHNSLNQERFYFIYLFYFDEIPLRILSRKYGHVKYTPLNPT